MNQHNDKGVALIERAPPLVSAPTLRRPPGPPWLRSGLLVARDAPRLEELAGGPRADTGIDQRGAPRPSHRRRSRRLARVEQRLRRNERHHHDVGQQRGRCRGRTACGWAIPQVQGYAST